MTQPDFLPASSGYPAYYDGTDARKHSGMGIASFVIAVAIGVLEFVAVVGAAIAVAKPGGAAPERSPLLVMMGLLICGGILAAVTGLVLGVVSLFLRDRKKVFGILGVVFNALILLGVIALLILGQIARARR